MEPAQTNLSARSARALLHRLRDANVTARSSAGTPSFRLVGCLSLDAPVETGVRYGIVLASGERRVLQFGWRDSVLVLELGDERPGPCVSRARALAARENADGEFEVGELAAAVHPECNDPERLTPFLLALARAALALEDSSPAGRRIASA